MDCAKKAFDRHGITCDTQIKVPDPEALKAMLA